MWSTTDAVCRGKDGEREDGEGEGEEEGEVELNEDI